MALLNSGAAGTDRPTFDDKVAFLSEPSSYSPPADEVTIKETHMSLVFLAGPRVFKMKKPVRYDFLDFSTLEARARMVEEEIRLNRRLAPGVYRRAAPLTLSSGGALAIGGSGAVVEWLVEMERLPETRMLDACLMTGAADRDAIEAVASRLVGFYRGLAPARISAEAYAGRFRAEHSLTARVLRDPRFDFGGANVEAILAGFERAIDTALPLLEGRVGEGRIVEGHGDLRPEHVCLTDPPVIIDCLEFDRSLRLVDPFDEISFLGLECAQIGADWVFPILRARLSQGLEDAPPDDLVAFYWQYRALLRARLALLHLVEPEPREPEKWRPLAGRYVALAEEAPVRTRSPKTG